MQSEIDRNLLKYGKDASRRKALMESEANRMVPFDDEAAELKAKQQQEEQLRQLISNKEKENKGKKVDKHPMVKQDSK